MKKFEYLKPEFEKVWKKDSKMVDYCINQITGVCNLSNDKIFIFEKQSIKTSFCYGFGQNGIAAEGEVEEAAESAKNARQKENFIVNNLERSFVDCEAIEKEDVKLYALPHYREETNIVSIYSEEFFESYPFKKKDVLFELSQDDIHKLREELANQKEMFKKRLETYWKKFGATKLKTWTYLVD